MIRKFFKAVVRTFQLAVVLTAVVITIIFPMFFIISVPLILYIGFSTGIISMSNPVWKNDDNVFERHPAPTVKGMGMSREDKKAYLRSPKWNSIRKQILKRDHYKCQSCMLYGMKLDVHHITYERLGDEKLEDLTSLCRECHSAIHRRLGYDRSTIYTVLSHELLRN